jgi:hypothetical protein
MSTPEAEIQVDLDEVAVREAAEAAKKTKTEPEVDLKVETAEKAQETTAKPVLTPDEGLKKLQKQLDDEKNLRIAAENREREARQAEVRAKTESQGTQLDLVKSAIASLTQANDALEEKYAGALASQDYPAAAKAQREMSANEAKLMDLNRGKTAMEQAPKPQPRTPDDPVERIASQLTAQSASWVRAHPEYARDHAKYRKMVAAHELAMADGFTADTPEYFASVEDTLRIAPAAEVHIDVDPTADTARPSARPSRQTAPPSAPVSRSGNGTGGNRPNVVRLSPEMREMAKLLFPDSKTPEEDYARNMQALKNEGKLN